MPRTTTPQRVTFYIGIEKDREGRQIDAQTRANALAAIRVKAAQTFGGYSLFNGAGGWINPEGHLVEEANIRLDIYSTASYAAIWGFAQESGRLLHQASILADLNGNATFIDIEPVEHYGEVVPVITDKSILH
jgi:hypothetical protein